MHVYHVISSVDIQSLFIDEMMKNLVCFFR